MLQSISFAKGRAKGEAAKDIDISLDFRAQDQNNDCDERATQDLRSILDSDSDEE